MVVEKLTTVADIQTIRHTLDNLFQETPTSEYLFRPSRFAPELLDTLAFRQCWRIARQVLGITALRSFDSAIYKHPHKDSGTPWHQDQAYNKTHRESSAPLPTVHFWIPLQAVTYANGCLQFIPNSHHSVLRHDPMPDNPTMLTALKVDTQKAITCPLQVGDATMHVGTTLHCAPPNKTETTRRAFTLVFR
ncbi:MAG TPA: phytanoyl-CoA dioxygenase family protein, partial [Nitrospiraceae bacterium]|nr:phytanoyl-CoA dioxygenase family protein [Nitrospiraceae bacterium]